MLNRAYALLVANMDGEQREKFDGELYAPAEGWDAVEARAFRNMAILAGSLGAAEVT